MKKTTDGRRVQKIEKEIQAVVGMYLINGFSEPLDVFVTLSRSVVSADLKIGKIYFTILPKVSTGKNDIDEETAQEVEDLLNKKASEFQRQIAKELKLRYTPILKFFHDRSVDKVRKVDQILSELSNQSKSKSKSE